MEKYPASSRPQAIVAGNLCLDIIPAFLKGGADLKSIFTPGTLSHIGPALISTGGAVSNVGIALNRLGVKSRLIGKVGDDAFAKLVRDVLKKQNPTLADDLIVDPVSQTSYTLVISPPGTDRFFLHYAGANETYGAADIESDKFDGARLFHFGYPPIMRRIYSDGGKELAAIFHAAKSRGLTTSLDMTHVDRNSDAGRVDWPAYLRHILPHVDLFLPSLDEILFMLGRQTASGEIINGELLDDLSQSLLTMGPAMVALKLGDQGLYLRTTSDLRRLGDMGGCTPEKLEPWRNRQVLAPCYVVEVAGTTGSGDCTIAGFLSALLAGLPMERVMSTAVGAGACCCEQIDATSGVLPWDSLHGRIDSSWQRREVRLPLAGWKWDQEKGMFRGAEDGQ